jgi:hypothetical protein
MTDAQIDGLDVQIMAKDTSAEIKTVTSTRKAENNEMADLLGAPHRICGSGCMDSMAGRNGFWNGLYTTRPLHSAQLMYKGLCFAF